MSGDFKKILVIFVVFVVISIIGYLGLFMFHQSNIIILQSNLIRNQKI